MYNTNDWFELIYQSNMSQSLKKITIKTNHRNTIYHVRVNKQMSKSFIE